MAIIVTLVIIYLVVDWRVKAAAEAYKEIESSY